jgi:hypothetical protein
MQKFVTVFFYIRQFKKEVFMLTVFSIVLGKNASQVDGPVFKAHIFELRAVDIRKGVLGNGNSEIIDHAFGVEFNVIYAPWGGHDYSTINVKAKRK